MGTFLTPSQIITKYKQILQSIKPSLNVNDNNSDFIIRGKTFSGMLSGLYGDQKKVDDDTFIKSCRLEALLIKGSDYGIPQLQATQAIGPQVRLTGVNGTIISPNALTLIYTPTGYFYTNTTGGTISGGVLDVAVECNITGQLGNVKFPDSLNLISVPPGLDASATLIQDIADGSDLESTDSYRSRLLSRIQAPPAGGNQTDYPQWAYEASPNVRSVIIRRFGRGLGTVDIYVTTGTTDIDTAVTNGNPIVRIPSSITLAVIQNYYNAHAPLTDCPVVYAPTEVLIPVTLNYVLAQGLTLTSVPSDSVNNPLNLNCGQLIDREVSRALYKLPVGGRKINGSTNGFAVAADIEENLDVWLSTTEGKIPILDDRQIQKLHGVDWNYPLIENQLAAPGTVTKISGV